MQKVTDLEYFMELFTTIGRKFTFKELEDFKITQLIVEGSDHVFEFSSVTGDYLR